MSDSNQIQSVLIAGAGIIIGSAVAAYAATSEPELKTPTKQEEFSLPVVKGKSFKKLERKMTRRGSMLNARPESNGPATKHKKKDSGRS